MDYSAANQALWNIIIQLGLIAGAMLLANFLRQKLAFIRRSLMPIAVLAGFLLLLAKLVGLVKLDGELMEILVYHGIALGFIAMSLRVPPEKKQEGGELTGLKSGAVIVSSYMIQGVTGLLITLLLSYTLMPARPTTSARAMRRWASPAGAASGSRSRRRATSWPASRASSS